MTLETLNKKLKYGEGIIFLDPTDNRYILIGGVGKDEYGNYRDTDWCNTIEECYQEIGSCDGYSQEFLKEKLPNWKYIESKPLALVDPVPAGTYIIILPNAEEECEKYHNPLYFSEEEKEMVGKKCKIKNYEGSDYWIEFEDKFGGSFPRTAFIIDPEENSEEFFYLFSKEDKNENIEQIIELLRKFLKNNNNKIRITIKPE